MVSIVVENSLVVLETATAVVSAEVVATVVVTSSADGGEAVVAIGS